MSERWTGKEMSVMQQRAKDDPECQRLTVEFEQAKEVSTLAYRTWQITRVSYEEAKLALTNRRKQIMRDMRREEEDDESRGSDLYTEEEHAALMRKLGGAG